MKFRVGPHTYRVKISDPEGEPLRNEDAQQVPSLLSWRDRTICLDGSLPLAQRLDALLAELRRAYVEHYGRPDDDAGLANQSATAHIEIQKQLELQGGLWALGQLQPGGIAEARVDTQSPSTAYAIQCPTCGGNIAIGEVQTSTPRVDTDVNHAVVDRSASCDFCGITVEWVEAATSSGKPNGKVIGGPTIRQTAASRQHQMN